MKKKAASFGFIGLIIGLIIGFAIANAVSREALSEQRRAAAAAGSIQSQPVQSEPAAPNKTVSQNALSAEEIRQAVKRADAEPENLNLQKDLGISLYQYAKMQGQVEFLPDVKRLLERTLKSNQGGDFDVLLVLGDVCSLAGGRKTDPILLTEARNYYEKALKLKPEAFELHTEIGLTYFLAKPSEPAKAVVEYRKTLAANPKNERARELLAATLIAERKIEDARAEIEILEQINSRSSALSDLQIQLAQAEIQK